MLKKEIKNILFDLGGVIVDLNRQRCIDMFRQLGVLNVDELTGDFSQAGIFMQFELGGINAETFRDEIRKNSGQNLTDGQIDDAWNSFLTGIPEYKLNALFALSKQYSLYLLSNTNELHWQWCKDHALGLDGFDFSKYFKQIFLSFELHKVKPSPSIFQEVLNLSGILPTETLFIDDSAANCETAGLLGLSAYNSQPGEDWRHLFNI